MTLVPKALGTPWAEPARHPWTLKRLKDVARVVNGYPFDSKLFDAKGKHALVRIRDLNSTSTETRYNGAWVTAASIDTGDVLVGMDGDFNVGTWQGGPALLNQRMCCVRGESTLMSRFLRYVLPMPLAVTNDLTYFTTVKHLSSLDVERLTVPVPPAHLLEPLVSFLDEQTARIDALIAEKETLRTAVQELFAARLGTAVIQGLASRRRYVQAAHKGFESVPEDWDLIPLKHLATSSGGMTPSKDNDAFWAGEIPWVSPKDMKRFVLHDSTDHISQAALESTSLKLNPVDSVLVVVRGMILAHTFPVAMNAVPVTINQDMKALRPNSRVSAKYLAWMLRGLQPLMLSLTEESAHGTKALRTDQWANQCVPLPPPREQVALVAAFESWEGESAALGSHLAEHIDRLREYRSSLISAAVTGGININH